MIDQSHRRLDRSDVGNAGRRTALDDDDIDPKIAGSGDLAIGGIATGILAHHDVDALVGEQLLFVGFGEWAACQDVAAIWHGERRIDRIDAPDEIAVLRRRAEAAGFLAADGEENATRGLAQRGHRSLDILDPDPAISVDRLPGRTPEREQRDAGHFRRRNRIGRYPAGEGMGRVDEQVDIFLSQVSNQAIDTAEAADPGRQGQGFRLAGPTRQRDRRVDIRPPCQAFGQSARLRRAAKNENAVLAHG